MISAWLVTQREGKVSLRGDSRLSPAGPVSGKVDKNGLNGSMAWQAFTPIEGVPERLGPMLPATAARRRLHTTTPGPKRAPPAGSAVADGRLLTPGDSAVLASEGDPDDQDSPVEGLLQRHADVRNQVGLELLQLVSQAAPALVCASRGLYPYSSGTATDVGHYWVVHSHVLCSGLIGSKIIPVDPVW